MPGGDVWAMIGASAGIGAVFAIAGALIVPLLYDVTLTGHMALPFIFGLYVAARGVRYIVKAPLQRHWPARDACAVQLAGAWRRGPCCSQAPSPQAADHSRLSRWQAF